MHVGLLGSTYPPQSSLSPRKKPLPADLPDEMGGRLCGDVRVGGVSMEVHTMCEAL